jgi:DNA-binding response OmpR family regulator
VRRTLCTILRVNGYKVVEAEDGRDGVDTFIRERCSLVITDLFMPDQDGIETIQRIRVLDSSVPILAISGADEMASSALQDARLLGATRTLAKPFDVKELLEAVRELVGLS